MPFPPIRTPNVEPEAITTATDTASDMAITLTWFGLDGALALVLMCISFIALTTHKPANKHVLRVQLGLLISTALVGAGMTAIYGLGWMLATAASASVVSWISMMFEDRLGSDAALWSSIPTHNLDDAQIKRVVGMVQQGKCDEHMRQKLLDLATSALPKLVERISAHRTAIEQIRPLRERLPTSEATWNLAQQTVNERFQRLIGRWARLEELEVACRQQLDALEAIMLDDALTASISGTLDAEHAQLMAAINDALDDARQQTDAHDEIDGLASDDVVNLRRRHIAATRARTPYHR